MKKISAILFLAVFSAFSAYAQVKAGQGKGGTAPVDPLRYTVRGMVVDGDTLPLIYLPDVSISQTMVFKNQKQAENYTKLKRDVKKTYPYAILAAAKLKEYNVKLAGMRIEAERKLYMKKAEKELIKQFEGDMRKLTVTQGKILIKLIDRETGTTSYDLVKELRGSFSAWMWQSLAVFFGTNLKTEYDATGNDRIIETIIYQIEGGQI
jgi:hypothetical protein